LHYVDSLTCKVLTRELTKEALATLHGGLVTSDDLHELINMLQIHMIQIPCDAWGETAIDEQHFVSITRAASVPHPELLTYPKLRKKDGQGHIH
jgi:hypothetical protein